MKTLAIEIGSTFPLWLALWLMLDNYLHVELSVGQWLLFTLPIGAALGLHDVILEHVYKRKSR